MIITHGSMLPMVLNILWKDDLWIGRRFQYVFSIFQIRYGYILAASFCIYSFSIEPIFFMLTQVERVMQGILGKKRKLGVFVCKKWFAVVDITVVHSNFVNDTYTRIQSVRSKQTPRPKRKRLVDNIEGTFR